MNTWKTFGPQDKYEISTSGLVRNIKTKREIKISINPKGYAFVTLWDSLEGKPKRMKIHREMARLFLVDFDKSLCVDHINGDKTDNKIENLRMLSSQQNSRAKWRESTASTSKYRGVHWNKKMKRWVASIGGVLAGCRCKYIGSFKSEEDAALAYNKEAASLGYEAEALNLI